MIVNERPLMLKEDGINKTVKLCSEGGNIMKMMNESQ